MRAIRTNASQWGTVVMALAMVAVLGGAAYAFLGARSDATASATVKQSDGHTGSVNPVAQKGNSGLPLPRFVSLKTDRVNVRRGPSNDHQVSWIFTRRGLPVEIIAEFEHWRRVRDSEGEEGWIYQSLLAGRRTAMVAPWRKSGTIGMHESPDKTSAVVAQMSAGVVGHVKSCTGQWCRIEIQGYDGWIAQPMLWGVYQGERISRD